MIEDEMFGWHHQLNGHEFEQTLEDSEGQFMGLQRVGHDLATEQKYTYMLWYHIYTSIYIS